MSVPFENTLPDLAALTAAVRAALNPDGIPAELKCIPHWVCWRYEFRNNKWTKPPYQADGHRADVSKPATWTDYETALAAWQSGDFAGIGFVLTADIRIVGGDLDHVLKPDSGELDPKAADIVAMLPTYCEVSPSGSGLRILALGTLPPGRRRKGNVEFYDAGRYLTVMGNRFNGHDALAECTVELATVHALMFGAPAKSKDDPTERERKGNAPPPVDTGFDLDDAALLNKARNARNGAEFSRLYDAGDTSGFNGDHSAADLALCNSLAFWTDRDAARMDRMFRQSGLFRPKWDVVHHSDGSTYGQATIGKAIADCRETYSGKRSTESAKAADGHRREDAGAGAARAGASETTVVDHDHDLFSDYGNVVKLLSRLSGRLAYTPGLDWLLYCPDTGVWEPEPGAERVKNLVLETLRDAWGTVLDKASGKAANLKKQRKELDEDAAAVATLDKQVKSAGSYKAQISAWLRQCETAYRIRSTLEIAEGYFWTRPETWDANPHILVCANGVIDLATGQLLPHSPNYCATKTTGTAFTPGARHPAWDAVVTLLQSEGDRYEFVHQFCGSGLHGSNPNERLVIFQGDGGTGKGTLLTGIHRAMGAYAETVEVGTLLATDWRKQNKSAPREDLLKLRGARFVYPSIEPPKDSKLDDASIKALTGNDAITARFPHSKNSLTFTPVFKLALQTNFPLRTEFDDPGMKRRVIVCPFNKKPDHPDPAIKNALMHDPTARAAVLAWLYEGYRVWRANSFELPVSALATEATADYWHEMNPFEQFASDVGLRFGRGLECLKPRMTGAFKAWREDAGRLDAKIKEFPKWLKSKGCHDGQKATLERFWYGVEFKESSPQPQQPQQPPFSENEAIDIHTSKSTSEFNETTGCKGCCGCGPSPADEPSPLDELLKRPPSPSVDASQPATGKPYPPNLCRWDKWGDNLLLKCSDPEPNADGTGCANCGASKPDVAS
jgi:putative DNA primase/helicase